MAALKREEAVWRAAAKEEATVGLRAERTASEKRARERVVEEGPGVEARETVGLVRIGLDRGASKVGPSSFFSSTTRLIPKSLSPQT